MGFAFDDKLAATGWLAEDAVDCARDGINIEWVEVLGSIAQNLGIHEVLLDITGVVPYAIVSSGGKPNPSMRDGKTYASALLSSQSRCPSGINPVK